MNSEGAVSRLLVGLLGLLFVGVVIRWVKINRPYRLGLGLCSNAFLACFGCCYFPVGYNVGVGSDRQMAG